MSHTIKAIAVALAITAAPAYAWGDREQGVLTGVAGLWVFQQLNKAGQQQPPQPQVVTPAPVYVVPQPYTHRPMYKMVDIYIPECNCTRSVLVQIN